MVCGLDVGRYMSVRKAWQQSASGAFDPRAARVHAFIVFIPNPEPTLMLLSTAQV